MKLINVRNVNLAAADGLQHLLKDGIEEASRNGSVLVAPAPVVTVYEKPMERVLFSPTRNANPFFHLMESLWMLAGRNDIEFPAQFNKRMNEYSDNGTIQWGAYGWRWRDFFGYDQLVVIIGELKKNPNSRRCVLSMWNAWMDMFCEEYDTSDLFVATKAGKDVPCNTHAYFDVRGGVLNMTVCNRSNDAIWGAYGANAVHFSFLLEYIAEQIGVPMGVYRQMSNNFHAYLDIYDREKLEAISLDASRTDLYHVYPDMRMVPLGSDAHDWSDKLGAFLDCGLSSSTEVDFFTTVAEPMYWAWKSYKNGEPEVALNYINTMPYCDWQVACLDWLTRHKKEKKNAA